DFRPICLIGSVYKIIAKILANRLIGVLDNIVHEVQLAFITDRQILDGPFILNEVIQWCKSKKKQSLIFKVDFEKAYDSVRWDFLDDVLKKFGFGNKWCNWIQCCLNSSRGSILVNGNPTEEFQFFKGLKQGDPLSPFLFILIMESLHLSFQRVVDVSMFKGLNLNVCDRNRKDVSVSEKMGDPHLDGSFRRAIRGWCEQEQFQTLEGVVNSTNLVQMEDRWVWNLESSGDFSVASFRRKIDDSRLPMVDDKTWWVKYMPIKINVLAWKVRVNALPTRFNLSRRDVVLPGSLGVWFRIGGTSRMLKWIRLKNGRIGAVLYALQLSRRWYLKAFGLRCGGTFGHIVT
nr:cysteine-rich receptor-like protein kinase [Tanacetum cinerariifolium]